VWKAFLVVLLAVSHLHYCVLMVWPIWPHLLIMVRICPMSDSTAKIQSILHTRTTYACAHKYTTTAYTHTLYHYIYTHALHYTHTTHTYVCAHYTTLHTLHYAIVCVCVCTFVVYVVMLGSIEILMHNETENYTLCTTTILLCDMIYPSAHCI